MKLLNRENLLTREQLQVKEVSLGNDEFVYVRSMTGKERELFENSIRKVVKDEDGKIVKYESSLDSFRAKMAVMTVCDKDGNLLLKPEDIETLNESLSAARLAKIADAASELNKISDSDKEDLLKNSAAGKTGNSNSDSVEN